MLLKDQILWQSLSFHHYSGELLQIGKFTKFPGKAFVEDWASFFASRSYFWTSKFPTTLCESRGRKVFTNEKIFLWCLMLVSKIRTQLSNESFISSFQLKTVLFGSVIYSAPINKMKFSFSFSFFSWVEPTKKSSCNLLIALQTLTGREQHCIKKIWNDEKQVYPLVTEIWTSTQLAYEKN